MYRAFYSGISKAQVDELLVLVELMIELIEPVVQASLTSKQLLEASLFIYDFVVVVIWMFSSSSYDFISSCLQIFFCC